MAPIIKSIAILLTFSSLAVFAAPLQRRQGAGTGAALDSIFSDTDDATGYGVENVEDGVAKIIGGVPKPAVPAAKRSVGGLVRRQGDKIANGAGAVLTAAGLPGVAGVVASNGDNVDGQATGDQALVGSQVGQDEEGVIIGTTALVARSAAN